jgi:predicted lipase
MESIKKTVDASKRLQYITLLIICIILLFLIFLVLNVYIRWKDLKKKAKNITSQFAKIIPHMENAEYKHINYLNKLRSNLHSKFSISTAQFLVNCIMSSYNISGGFDPRLPDNMELISTIGDNGHLYKYDNVYIISYRGTMSNGDLIADFDFSQTTFIGRNFISASSPQILVHRGFFNLWKKNLDSLYAAIKKIPLKSTLLITGHSLGSAMAAFTALDLANKYLDNIKLYMFGPPRIGNNLFTMALQKNINHNWAVINARDVVCELPPPNFSMLGTLWLYDDYKNIYRGDYETGETIGNHHLESYSVIVKGLSVAHTKHIWLRRPIMITIKD